MENEESRNSPKAPPPMKRISEVVWEISPNFKRDMLVPARIYATENLVKAMDPGVFNQLINVACLPGIQKYALCMPDGHWGYGFPIGGVGAFDLEKGIISPGGIGFDINCGVRLLRTNLTLDKVRPKLKEIIDISFKLIPAGVGARGAIKIDRKQFNDIMIEGVKWAVDNGYGWKEDLGHAEDYGKIPEANPESVSQKAISRGINQLCTLGSGNHYFELQYVDNIFDADIAKKWGITQKGQICIMIHCGSRGFGHQIATDYLQVFSEAMKKYKISVMDRELACAPFQSEEGQRYFQAMACAANTAFANRQIISHRTRLAFERVFGSSAEELDMGVIYDVAHNIAKIEEHDINGKKKKVLMHRKGATRCFGPSRNELPTEFRNTGQPVIIGGSMETGSWLLVGTDKSEETFGSTMHGAGRTMSRSQAKHKVRGEQLKNDMEKRGIYVQAVSMSGLAEEAGVAYKDVNEVVETMHIAGITKKVVSLRPIGNIKG